MLHDQNLKIRVGDKVKVTVRVKEGDKERLQTFEGTVIRIKGAGDNRTFTVRRIGASNVGIERIWPVKSPNIVSAQVVGSSTVRRAKLYYLRDQIGKAARLKPRLVQNSS